MADLPIYQDLENKKALFSNGEAGSFIIETKAQLDRWFKDVEDQEKEESKIDATTWIYRGMSEAKYKLLTFAQRIWITNEMHHGRIKIILASLVN